MVSFRADEEDVAAAERWAKVLGVERSELLRDALAAHLSRLAAEDEALAYERAPFTVTTEPTDSWPPGEIVSYGRRMTKPASTASSTTIVRLTSDQCHHRHLRRSVPAAPGGGGGGAHVGGG